MYEYKLESIKSIYDGDTFIGRVDVGFGVIKEEKFRLAYINAPELRGETYEAGKASRDWLRNRIQEAYDANKLILIKTIKDSKEKYGRYLADIWIDDISVNKQMVELGLAVSFMD